jgi:hypothetical protein
MDKQTFDKLVTSFDSISTSEASQLEELLATFPYCQTAHLLIAKVSHDKNSMHYPQKLRKASAYVLDRKILHRLIKSTSEPKAEKTAPVSIPKPIPSPPSNPIVTPKNISLLEELEENIKKARENRTRFERSLEQTSIAESFVPSPVSKQESQDLPIAVFVEETKEIATPLVAQELTELSTPVLAQEPEDIPTPAIEQELTEPPVFVEEAKEIALPVLEQEHIEIPTTTIEEEPTNLPVAVFVEEPIELSSPVLVQELKETSIPVFVPEPREITTPVLAFTQPREAKTREQQAVQLPNRPVSDSRYGYEIHAGNETDLLLAYLRKTINLHLEQDETPEPQSKVIDQFLITQPRITSNANHLEDNDKKDMSQSSVEMVEEIVTENYALILTKQHKFAKARNVYQKLMLKYPDKSAYFAAKLTELDSK